MAMIISPRELMRDGQPSGLFHMTEHSDEDSRQIIYPVGLCAENCPGHSTPAEAYLHYRQGLLVKARFDAVDENEQRKCAVCGEWTNKAAYVNSTMFEMWPLCDLHLNKESLAPIVLAVPTTPA
jgi:hypothetical protein